MLKERDYASVARLLDRTASMKGDTDTEGEKGDPADDIDFCNEVLDLLSQLRAVLAEEIAEGDPDVTTAFASDAVGEVDDLIGDVTALKEALSGGSTRPAGYVPG